MIASNAANTVSGPDDLTDAEDFIIRDESATQQANSVPSTLEDDLAAQLFGEEDDDFAAGLFSDEEEKIDDEHDKSENQASPTLGDAEPEPVDAAKPAVFEERLLGEPVFEERFLEEAAAAGGEVPQPVEPAAATLSTGSSAPPVGREVDYAARGDKMSRFTKDAAGNLIHKWKADYAPRGGGGRAQCRDLDCLERHEQSGLRTIEKGCLRIGRRVLMPGKGEGEDSQISFFWHHARCIFNSFLRSRKGTRLIESEDDIEDFHLISQDDQALLRRIIAGAEDLRKAKFAEGQHLNTPAKRGLDDVDYTPAKRRKGTDPPELIAGYRVWTHCRVRAPVPTGGVPPAGDVSVKSPKPELACIVEEPKDGRVIVQFESQEHEKERLQMHGEKKHKMIRGWLRYPRVFEGKKQRVPINWIKSDRPPPKLCGCCKQNWGHCSRGNSVSVWGVAVQ